MKYTKQQNSLVGQLYERESGKNQNLSLPKQKTNKQTKKPHHTLKVNKRGRKEQNNQKKKVTGQEYVLTFH
jgi:hypothetical protein